MACGTDDVYEPSNSYRGLVDDELTKAGVLAGSSSAGGTAGAAGASGERVVQIKPQHVALKLRVSEYLPLFC